MSGIQVKMSRQVARALCREATAHALLATPTERQHTTAHGLIVKTEIHTAPTSLRVPSVQGAVAMDVPRHLARQAMSDDGTLYSVGVADDRKSVSSTWPYRLHSIGYSQRRARRLLAHKVSRALATVVLRTNEQMGIEAVLAMPMIAALGDRARRIVLGGSVGGGFWRRTLRRAAQAPLNREASRFKDRTGLDPFRPFPRKNRRGG